MATLFEDDPPFANNPALRAVLDNHGLLNTDGSWRITDVAFQHQGPGPLIDPAVIEKFAALDHTRNMKVLDWMLMAAGGGAPALEQSKQQIAAAREIYIGERMQGRGDDGDPIEPMSQEQAEIAWQAVAPLYQKALLPADQDMLEHFDYKVFGYGRYWPGPHNIYADVYDNTKLFLENMIGRSGGQSKVSLINLARQRRAGAGGQHVPIITDLTQYQSVEDLKKVNDEFFYYFKRAQAKKDVQFIGSPKTSGPEVTYPRGKDIHFYDDPNITAWIPATAAAMMQVGFDNWCVANATEFERGFHHDAEHRQPPRWMEYSRTAPFMVIHFKGDVSEPETPPGHEHHQSLKRLAVWLRHCDLANLAEPYEGAQFFDRINRWTPRPVDWPELVGRLERIPNGPAVLASVKAAMDAFSAWARQMKEGDIKVSVYEMLAMRLVYSLLNS